MVIRRVGVFSAAKIAGALYGLIGLLFGALFSLISVVGGAAAMSQGGEDGAIGMFLGVGAVIMFPIFYGVIGAIFAAISAAFYNLIAGFVGGLEIEIESTAGGTAPVAARPDSPY